MYYLLSLFNAFNGIGIVIIGILCGVELTSAICKVAAKSISWRKLNLISASSMLFFVIITMCMGILGLFEGYGLVVGVVVDRLFGSSWSPLQAAFGSMMLAMLPLTTQIVIGGGLLLGWWASRSEKIRQVPEKRDQIKALFVSLLIAPVFSLGISFIGMYVNERCNTTIAIKFNEFNAHLKDVCFERENQSECPKNVSQLSAFDEKGYRGLENCTSIEYVNNTANNETTWYVFTADGGVLVASEQYYPGFGYFHKHAEID